MPSLLARLRSRRVTTESSTSPTTSPVYYATPSTSSVPTTSPVDRKIHPNLDSLLEDYSTQLEQESEPSQGSVAEFGTSLKPSLSRRHSVDRSTRIRLLRPMPANLGTLDNVDEIMETTASVPELISQPPTADLTLEDDPSRARRIFDRISYLASPSEWSTFGRNRDHPSPGLGDFGQEMGATQHSQLESLDLSTVTVRRSRSSPRSTASSSVHSVASCPSTSTAPEVPSTTPSRKSSFKHHETHTTDGVSSSRKNQAVTTPIKSRPNTSSSDIGLDSPRTFGYPTPPDSSGFTFCFRSGYGSRSSPPPLPPFNHPELAAALRAKSSAMPVVSQKELSQGPSHDTIFDSIHDRTFPRRSRPVNDNSAFASLPSFSLVNLRSRSKSLPQVQQIFATPARHSARTVRSRPRARSRTAPGRRSSAEWSAQEATSGDKFSWPAQVSREILRLSFGEAGVGPTARGPEAHGKHMAITEQGNTISPVTHHNLLSESLGSPFFQAGAVGPNLSDNPSYGHSTMDGKEGAPTPIAATSSKNAADGSKNTGKGKASERRSTPSPPKKGVSSSTSMQASANAGPSSPSRPTAVSGPLPASEPLARRTSRRSTSEPGPSVLQVPSATPMRQTASSSSTASKGKRKAEEVEGTPPDQKKEIQRATFSLPPRPHRESANSGSSHAPSSYHRKRPRLSAPTSLTSPPESLSTQQLHAGNTGSWGSRASSTRPSIHPRPSSRAASRAASTRSAEKLPRSSMSQVSIPISALISPHAPSVGRSSTFHMSDPRKPPRQQATGWSLSLRTRGEPGSGSPLHAWCFFIGFIIFPIWWVASVWSTPKTRLVGGTDVEKAVTLDDPQVEHDAKSWRLRCRIMSVVSLLTYIPFIVLVVIFAPQ